MLDLFLVQFVRWHCSAINDTDSLGFTDKTRGIRHNGRHLSEHASRISRQDMTGGYTSRDYGTLATHAAVPDTDAWPVY
jgi:hypothetical protein